MTVTKDKLWDLLARTMHCTTAITSLGLLQDCVDACFPAVESALRVCSDEDGALQQMIVAAVLSYEVKNWDTFRTDGLDSCLSASHYAAFWVLYKKVKSENLEDFATVSQARQVKREKKRAKNQMEFEARRTIALQKILDVQTPSAPAPTQDNTPATNGPDSRINEEAQSGKNKKKKARRARAQAAEAALAMNAGVRRH